MPTFATPEPICVIVDPVVGDTKIIATDRDDTVVVVQPRDESNQLDVKFASETRIDYSPGKLTIKAPKPFQRYFASRYGTVDVTVEVPTGSDVRGSTAMGDLFCEGRLGNVMFKTAMGDISLDLAGAVNLSTMQGRIIVDRVAGDGMVTGSGEIRIGEITGSAMVKNLNGNSWIGGIGGDATLNSAHGNISVDRAGADLMARTAFGDVHVGEVARGTAVVQTAAGNLEVGIREGSAAWLDVKSSLGKVRTDLASTGRPEPAEETVQVRARTYQGDITIRYATPT